MRHKCKTLKYNVMTYFTRLNIGRQLFLGYLPLVLLVVIVFFYVMYNIGGVNRISNSLVENDSVIISSADKLVSNLLGQESYGQRYIILEREEMLDIFWQRSAEYSIILESLRSLPESPPKELKQLSELHKKYNSVYLRFFNEKKKSMEIFKAVYEKDLKELIDKMLSVTAEMAKAYEKARNTKMFEISTVGVRTFRVTALLTVIGILFGLFAAVLITRNIAGSVKKLKLATKQISEGNFAYVLKLNRRDELGDLAVAFSSMAKQLSRWEEMYLDASPLTRLPGGVAIDNVLKKRLAAGKNLAFCLIDLDNFKSFNDKYGYAMGNVIIKTTAKIIEKSITEHGTEEDFIGHIGGDDFAVIATRERVIAICSFIVAEFDKTIPDFYDEVDRKLGYIEGKTRQGERLDFPIMTVSIAIVTNDEQKNMNYLEVGEVAAELKEHAKMVSGSVYLYDRRTGKEPEKINCAV